MIIFKKILNKIYDFKQIKNYYFLIEQKLFQKTNKYRRKLDSQYIYPSIMMIGILIKDRPNSLNICLNSLIMSIKKSQSKIELQIHLFDDNSTDFETKNIINNFPKQIDGVAIFKHHRNKSDNTWASSRNWALSIFKEIKEPAFFGTCDSDLIFHPYWIDNFLSWACTTREKANTNGIYFSAFNSSNQAFHKVIAEHRIENFEYLEKQRIGGAHLFSFNFDKFTTKSYPNSKFKRGKVIQEFDDESIFTRKMYRRNYSNLCLKSSLVEHQNGISLLNQFRSKRVESPVFGLNLARMETSFLNALNLNRTSTLGILQQNNLDLKLNDDQKISIILPVSKQDIETLPMCLDSIEKYFKNKVDNINIISNKIFKKTILNKIGLANNFIDEREIIDRKITKGKSWVYQQLLKWQLILLTQKNSFIIDADTILTKDMVVKDKSRELLLVNENFNEDYRLGFKRLTNIESMLNYSFVTHMQFVNYRILSMLIAKIEDHNNDEWKNSIMKNILSSGSSFLSEYEYYGVYSFVTNEKNLIMNYSKNISAGRNNLKLLKDSQYFLNRDISSISYHWYLPKNFLYSPYLKIIS